MGWHLPCASFVSLSVHPEKVNEIGTAGINFLGLPVVVVELRGAKVVPLEVIRLTPSPGPGRAKADAASNSSIKIHFGTPILLLAIQNPTDVSPSLYVGCFIFFRVHLEIKSSSASGWSNLSAFTTAKWPQFLRSRFPYIIYQLWNPRYANRTWPLFL